MNRSDLLPPVIEVSLDAIISNLNGIRNLLIPGQKVMAVVKDCAYGCGARIIAACLEEHGVDFFAVARANEAEDLRNNGIKSPVLVLGICDEESVRRLHNQNIVFSINDLSGIRFLSELKIPVSVHVNIDTGMGRLGILPSEVETAAGLLAGASSLTVHGLFTHFASADIPETETVRLQQNIFCRAIEQFADRGIRPRVIHSSNSAAIDRFPSKTSLYVRPGIALYGCNPHPGQAFRFNLTQTVSLKAAVVKLKKVPAGTAVSYGGNYVTKQETYIATVSAGYGHGLPRVLGNRGDILINGKRYRIAGNVTMDYCMVDAGPSPSIQPGDEAVLIGRQGNECITTDEIALLCNTIGYEILCNLSCRIERRYILNNKVSSVESGMLY